MKQNNLLLILLKYAPTSIVVLFLFTTTTITGVKSETKGRRGNEAANCLIEPLLKFTSKLYGSELGDENIILSPISIHKALNLVLLGTDRSTNTEDELINTLGFDGLSPRDIRKCHQEYSRILTKFKRITRNSLKLYENRRQDEEPGYKYGPKPPVLDLFNMIITKNNGRVLAGYSKAIRRYYDSSIVQIDDNEPETKSALLDKLNTWSKEAEFNSPIVTSSDLEGDFSTLLLSAIRVQAFWFDDFDEIEGDDRMLFHQYGLANQTVAAKWLSQSDMSRSRYIEFTTEDKAQYKSLHSRMTSSSSAALFDELSSLNFHVVELPLEGDLSFAIFEPLNISGSGGELAELASQLFSPGELPATGTSNIGKVLSLLDGKSGGTPVQHLRFPKFNFESEIDLKPVLQSLGLNRAFSAAEAEITKMTQDKMFIDEIKHQAVIDVNKFGIKAAGVTLVRTALHSYTHYSEPIHVSIENPFIFMLRYQKIPLFVGQLVKL